jgi:hypothetical protein
MKGTKMKQTIKLIGIGVNYIETWMDKECDEKRDKNE